MTFARLSLASLFVVVSTSFVGTADAASYHSIDKKAVRLQNKASKLYWELNAHFRHAAHYGQLRSNASQMYFLARDIHLLAHSRDGLNQMSHKLDRLDRLFHDTEDLLDHIIHDAEHGLGHIHGHLGHVQELVESMEHTLCSLRDEVRDLQYHRHHDHYYGPVWGHVDHGGHGPHGHGAHGGHGTHGRRGAHSGHGPHGGAISFGNGSFKIKFGF